MNIKTYSMDNGFMVIWDKVEDAVRYFVHLKVADYGANGGREKPNEIKSIEIIKTVEVERSLLYYSFINLAHLSNTIYHENNGPWGGSSWTDYFECKNYFVSVEAESKDGKIIDKSDDIVGLIKYGVKTDIDWRK